MRPIRDAPDEQVFRFELGPAILAQLLETLRRAPLRPIRDALKEARHPGFYQIFLDGDPKYVGKTSRSIRARLREHVSKLRGRVELERVGAKFAFVEDPSLVDVSENALIDYFGEHGLAEWNATGFGSKVTGYRRGKQIASQWAQKYPANLDWPITAGRAESISLYDLIKQIASASPITFSLPKSQRPQFRKDHQEPIAVAEGERGFQEWVDLVRGSLAPGWKVETHPMGWYVVKRDD